MLDLHIFLKTILSLIKRGFVPQWNAICSFDGMVAVCPFRGMVAYSLVRWLGKRRLPNNRASIDQTPGPSIATLADSTARKT